MGERNRPDLIANLNLWNFCFWISLVLAPIFALLPLEVLYIPIIFIAGFLPPYLFFPAFVLTSILNPAFFLFLKIKLKWYNTLAFTLVPSSLAGILLLVVLPQAGGLFWLPAGSLFVGSALFATGAALYAYRVEITTKGRWNYGAAWLFAATTSVLASVALTLLGTRLMELLGPSGNPFWRHLSVFLYFVVPTVLALTATQLAASARQVKREGDISTNESILTSI